MSVTQQEMADLLGISRQLVGFALSGHRGVSEDTRLKVVALAQELGYQAHSNRSARLMAGRRNGRPVKSGIIAIITTSAESLPMRSMPFHTQLLDSIEMEAQLKGLDLFICSPRNQRLPPIIHDLGVDGLILMDNNPIFRASIRDDPIPKVVFVSDGEGVARLWCDNRSGTRQATEQLIQLGHRRIAFLGHDDRFSTARDRIAGYRDAHANFGLPLDEELLELTINHQGIGAGAMGLKRLLERTPQSGGTGKPSFTALVCYNDQIAMGAVNQAQESDLSVPRDLSVVGFDDVTEMHGFRPVITSITFDRAAMGRRAVELLAADTPVARDYSEVFPVHLVEHCTTPPRD